MGSDKSLENVATGGKGDFDVTGSASNSEADTHQSGTKAKGGQTFLTTGLSKDHYRPVETYEGIHRYDPDFEWDQAEEKRVVRKVGIALHRPEACC